MSSPMPAGSDLDYGAVLIDHGLRKEMATDQEKSLAIEVMQLRRLLSDGGAHDDIPTLRRVQECKNRVISAAIAYVDNENAAAAFENAVRQLQRLTGGDHAGRG